MKAVFSFYNTTGNPLKSARNWLNPEFFLYTWILAVHHASQFFDEVELVTDSNCKPLFESLQLPFTSIRTDLDCMHNYPKEFWALGKVKAYQLQDKPFVHIDNDVILFNGLPNHFLEAPIGFQNEEKGRLFDVIYRPHLAKLNPASPYPKSFGAVDYAVNCGVYLCNDLDYNKEYCRQAFEFVGQHQNHILTHNQRSASWYCIIFEQYIAACVAEELEVRPAYLSKEHRQKDYDQLQYVHIWGDKNNVKWFETIKGIAENQYPDKVEIVKQLLKNEK